MAGRVFITGAGGVLGRAYIEKLLDRGFDVIASDLPHKSLELKKQFESNPSFSCFDLDVTDEIAIDLLFRDRIQEIEPQIVVNNAAIMSELLAKAEVEFPGFLKPLPSIGIERSKLT